MTLNSVPSNLSRPLFIHTSPNLLRLIKCPELNHSFNLGPDIYDCYFLSDAQAGRITPTEENEEIESNSFSICCEKVACLSEVKSDRDVKWMDCITVWLKRLWWQKWKWWYISFWRHLRVGIWPCSEWRNWGWYKNINIDFHKNRKKVTLGGIIQCLLWGLGG